MAAMLDAQIHAIVKRSQAYGWVLEPDAKHILEQAGIRVPRNQLASQASEAIAFARQIGYPVVAKIVSPEVIHKSEVNGVTIDIRTDEQLRAVFNRYARTKSFVGVLVEQMVSGIELIVGGKVDAQFGPVILLGIGGTGVEIYRDAALRMAPIKERDVLSMINCLTGSRMLKGFRGTPPIDMQALTGLIVDFSKLFMKWERQIASIDLNPVICSSNGCTVADARMILINPRP